MFDIKTVSKPRIITRRQFLVGLGAVVVGGAGFYGYGHGPGRHHIGVIEHDVYIPDLPSSFNGFTIAQMSDFHYGPFDEESIVRRAVEIVNGLKPSLTVLTGDFITANHYDNNKNLDSAARCAIELSSLTMPRFASLGNHDTIDVTGVTQALVSRKIPVLNNARVALEMQGERVWLGGVADACFDKPDPLKALPEYREGEPVILLGHEPDYVDEVVKQAKANHRRCDLMLSGHTHGGQVNLPGVTRFMLPEWGKKYIHGPFQIENTLLYVNRGLGTVHMPVRFNARPEITLFHLHGQK